MNQNITRILLVTSIMLIQFLFWFFDRNNLVFVSMIESLFDVIVSIMIMITLNVSNKPADENHPYGHSKIENIISLSFSIIFVYVSIKLIQENILDIVHHKISSSMDFNFLYMIILVMIPSITIIYTEYLNIKKSNSEIVKFNLIHYSTDLFKIFLILVSWMVSRFVDIWYFDFASSILLAAVMIVSLIPNIVQNFNILSDHEISEDDMKKLESIIHGYNISNLRTRESGSINFIEFDLILKSDISLDDANMIRSMLETTIKNAISSSDVNITVTCIPDAEKSTV